MPRDSQRSKCYRWERSIEDITVLAPATKIDTLEECRSLAEVVWLDVVGGHEYSEYRDCPPKVKNAHGSRYASCYRTFPSTIELTSFGRNIYTVLHEVAHAIISRSEWHGTAKLVPSHGPHFVALLMRLYNKYLGINFDTMVLLAEKGRVKFVSDDELDTFLNR